MQVFDHYVRKKKKKLLNYGQFVICPMVKFRRTHDVPKLKRTEEG